MGLAKPHIVDDELAEDEMARRAGRARGAAGGTAPDRGAAVRGRRAARRQDPARAPARGRRYRERDAPPAGRIRAARRQPRARRRQMDVPHRQRSRLAARARRGRAEEAVARRQRDARDHRLSPAGDARRDRGHPRRRRCRRARSTCCWRPAGSARAAGARRRAVRSPSAPPKRSSSHFGLEAIGDLPGLDELKGTGLLDGRLPAGFSVPLPSDDAALRDDEDPLEPGDLDLGLAPRPESPPEE